MPSLRLASCCNVLVVKGAGATARAFYDFLQTPQARGVFKRYGFVLPSETP